MGNKRIPARLKIARGTFDPSRETFAEEYYARVQSIPTPPEFAVKHNLQDYWYNVCKALWDVGLLYEVSIPQIERYIKFQFVFNKSFERIAESDVVIAGTTGEKVHPAINAMVKANKAMLEFEKRLNVAPAYMPNAKVDKALAEQRRSDDDFGLEDD